MANKKKKLKKNVIVMIAAAVITVFVILMISVGNHDADPSSTSLSGDQADAQNSWEEETGGFQSQYEYYSGYQIEHLEEVLANSQKVNSDVKAILNFPSGLISQPVLQGVDNTEYLYKDWITGADQSYGSITLDYRNNLENEDMNTIIYGHYVYEARSEDRTLAFTPLSQLLDENNYASNSIVSLILPDEIRYYQIAAVYDCLMEEVEGGQVAAENMQFNLLTYDEDYFQEYVDAVKENAYYDTGVTLSYGDDLLSLSTCIEEHPESREIVLCKKIGSEAFHQ